MRGIAPRQTVAQTCRETHEPEQRDGTQRRSASGERAERRCDQNAMVQQRVEGDHAPQSGSDSSSDDAALWGLHGRHPTTDTTVNCANVPKADGG